MGGLYLPCGKCLACKLSKAREWSLRLAHELQDWSDATFVTLTYSDQNLPLGGNLVKKDLQLFFKRVRKDLQKNQKIKYYAVGEYGDRYGRPHYHAILFGLSPNSPLILDNWTAGLVHCGTVTEQSIFYTAGYIQKKLYGYKDYDPYQGMQPPFSIMSLKPAIGLNFLKDHEEALASDPSSLTYRGAPSGLPRYYKNKLSDKYGDEFDKKISDLSIQHQAEVFDYWADKTGETRLHVEHVALPDARKQADKNLNAKIALKKRGTM